LLQQQVVAQPKASETPDGYCSGFAPRTVNPVTSNEKKGKKKIVSGPEPGVLKTKIQKEPSCSTEKKTTERSGRIIVKQGGRGVLNSLKWPGTKRRYNELGREKNVSAACKRKKRTYGSQGTEEEGNLGLELPLSSSISERRRSNLGGGCPHSLNLGGGLRKMALVLSKIYLFRKERKKILKMKQSMAKEGEKREGRIEDHFSIRRGCFASIGRPFKLVYLQDWGLTGLSTHHLLKSREKEEKKQKKDGTTSSYGNPKTLCRKGAKLKNESI